MPTLAHPCTIPRSSSLLSIPESWLAGAGRREPYGAAAPIVDKDILLLSWTYSTTAYDQQIIADDVDFMHNNSLQWIGCPWMNVQNVQLWADSLARSKELYGSTFGKGMVDTNWGGGRIENGLLPTARTAWNLRDRVWP